jgi:hypothetical protein
MKKTFDLTPTWEAAVNIYIAVLQNPTASFDAVKAAKEDLISLARSVDALNNK